MGKESILSIGTAYLDLDIFGVPDLNLPPEVKVVFASLPYEISPGGSALKFAQVCSSMGLETIFIGKAGKDPIGLALQNSIQKSGVIPELILSPDVQTNVAIHLHTEKGVLMIGSGSANESLTIDEVREVFRKHVAGASFVYLGGVFSLKSFSLESYMELARIAHSNGVKVVLDHGRISNRITEEDIHKIQLLVSEVDYYLPSMDEFLYVWGEDLTEALRNVREKSTAVVVVKDSDRGAIGLDDSEITKVPAFPVAITNNEIGAGDSFNAGFLKATALGLSFEESIQFGCATAAVKISQPGLPTYEKVTDFLTNQTTLIPQSFPSPGSPSAPNPPLLQL